MQASRKEEQEVNKNMVRETYATPEFDKKFGGKTFERAGGGHKKRADANFEATLQRKRGKLARVFKRRAGEYYVYVRGK